MPYATEVRVPIQPNTLDVLRKAVEWAKRREIADVPVTFDDGTTGTVPLGSITLEIAIAEVQAEVDDATASEAEVQSALAALNARLADLVAQRA